MKKFLNRVGSDPVIAAISAIALFILLESVLPLRTLIIILNGLFFGSLAALVMTFWRLIVHSVFGKEEFDRADRLALSIVLWWTAYIISAYGSVYVRSTGSMTVDMLSTAVHRYIAIVAAVMMVTSPDFGQGPFYGKDRKALWISLGVGLVVSAAVVFIQTDETLAPLVRDTALFMLIDPSIVMAADAPR